MSFWNNIIKSISGTETRDSSRYAFVDVEVGSTDHKIHDIGAMRWDRTVFHSADKHELSNFLKDIDFICGHNIIHHDAKYLFGEESHRWTLVDTLYVSPLLFPEKPYHRLLKDDKLMSEQLNNPINDCQKARDLLMDEVAQWHALSDRKKIIFTALLHNASEFKGFLEYVSAKYERRDNTANLIRAEYYGKICEKANLEEIITQYPCELAYALALVETTDYRSITPSWVLRNYPNVEYIVRLLRQTRCERGCNYCNKALNIHYNLKHFFGYDQFRTY